MTAKLLYSPSFCIPEGSKLKPQTVYVYHVYHTRLRRVRRHPSDSCQPHVTRAELSIAFFIVVLPVDYHYLVNKACFSYRRACTRTYGTTLLLAKADLCSYAPTPFRDDYRSLVMSCLEWRGDGMRQTEFTSCSFTCRLSLRMCVGSEKRTPIFHLSSRAQTALPRLALLR